MPRSYPGSTLGIDPRSQGVIPRRFKRKKFFVMNVMNVTNVTEGRTDRRDGRNSDLDISKNWNGVFCFTYKRSVIYDTISRLLSVLSTVCTVCPDGF